MRRPRLRIARLLSGSGASEWGFHPFYDHCRVCGRSTRPHLEAGVCVDCWRAAHGYPPRVDPLGLTAGPALRAYEMDPRHHAYHRRVSAAVSDKEG